MKSFFLLLLVFSFGFLAIAQDKQYDLWRFEEEVRAYEDEDIINGIPAKSILFTGSSSIRLWHELPQSFPGAVILRRGIGGAIVDDLEYFKERLITKYSPVKIFLYIGDNDVSSDRQVRYAVNRIISFIKELQQDLPQTKIFFLSIKPSPARMHYLNKMRFANDLFQKEISFLDDVQYIDLFNPMLDKNGNPDLSLFAKDKLHMNNKGYELWKKILRPHVY